MEEKAILLQVQILLGTAFPRDFFIQSNSYSAEEMEIYADTRIIEIQDAQKEIDRRLSVSYTNLGMVYRQKELYDSAAANYIIAVELWDQNLTAENNLNILFGKPLRKRNLIQKLFPPKKH